MLFSTGKPVRAKHKIICSEFAEKHIFIPGCVFFIPFALKSAFYRKINKRCRFLHFRTVKRNLLHLHTDIFPVIVVAHRVRTVVGKSQLRTSIFFCLQNIIRRETIRVIAQKCMCMIIRYLHSVRFIHSRNYTVFIKLRKPIQRIPYFYFKLLCILFKFYDIYSYEHFIPGISAEQTGMFLLLKIHYPLRRKLHNL